MKPRITFSSTRGNVVLTALFIAVFLFFLSVALLAANKQDIALSLSMEHKLKAEMAARSVAFEAYGHLREYGKLSGALGLPLEKDVETNVELVEIPSTAHRGKLLDIHARGTSGPFSSYFTMRLQPTELTSAKDGPGKVMILPQGDKNAWAIYGNFELEDMKQKLPTRLFANEGPVFTVSTLAEGTRAAFQDTLPLFTQDKKLQGVGPLVVLGPQPAANTETSLQWLEYKGGTFEWQNIPAPGSLSAPAMSGSTATSVYEMSASGDWTHASAHGYAAEVLGYSWTDREPPTSSVEETDGTLATFGPVGAAPVGSYQPGANQQFFTTRGAIAAQGPDVYSHAWQYLYLPYRGGVPGEITPLSGSILVRWPCVLKYSTTGHSWSVAWSSLQNDGSVRDPRTPHPEHLWVSSSGVLYSLTSSGETRLITLEEGGRVKVADERLPAGTVFLYRDQPWILTPEPGRMINLLDGSRIDFHSLPTGVPGYHGTMLDIPQGRTVRYDEPGTNDISPEGAFVIEGYKPQTVLPDFLLGYEFGEGRPVVSGNDLYVQLKVTVDGVDSLYELYDKKYVRENALAGGTVMARYDGEHWHILPNGLRAFLDRERQAELNSASPTEDEPEPGQEEEEEEETPPGETLEIPPGMADAVMATYPGLPAMIPRYSVISISTDPFQMGPR